MPVKRKLGEWACGDRKTVERVQYEKALGSESVAVVTIERTRTLSPSMGFIPDRYAPRVVPLALARKYGGSREYFDVSQSLSEADSLLPNTGPMYTVQNLRSIAAKLRAKGFVKTRTSKIVRNQWEIIHHVPSEQTPLGRLRFPSPKMSRPQRRVKKGA